MKSFFFYFIKKIFSPLGLNNIAAICKPGSTFSRYVGLTVSAWVLEKSKNKNKIIDTLNNNKVYFQKSISNAKLKSKFTPKIVFFLDDTFDEAEKIEKLLLK